MDDDPTGRINRLEMRLTEQQAVIDDLNAAITAQWRVIDALKRQVEQLAEQLAETAERTASGAPERPPPHY